MRLEALIAKLLRIESLPARAGVARNAIESAVQRDLSEAKAQAEPEQLVIRIS